MEILTSQYKEELLREIEGLPSEKIKEILDFVCFIKAKEAIDPTQAYFWTRKWQEMEREADKDKEKGDIIGNGSAENLLESLAE
jgi:hypothetical protein